MDNKKRINVFQTIIVVLFVGLFLFLNLYTADHQSHVCSGEDCAICEVMTTYETTVNKVLPVTAAVVIAFVLIVTYKKLLSFVYIIVKKIETLISLRVRLND